MSRKRPETDIELHFCQACGVSIPQADIDSGIANPEPGQCAFLNAPERCPIKFNESPSPGAPPPARETATRALVTIGLLYVVGVTTFLLVREMRRETPKVDLTDVARVQHLEQVENEIGRLDEGVRVALQDLEGNDERQRKDIAALDERVVGLVRADEELAERVDARANELRDVVLDLVNRTVGLTSDVESVLEEVRALGGRVEDTARGGGDDGADTPKADDGGGREEPKPRKTKQDLENERLLAEYIAKLKDKRATDQTRYNAAVQLGDLSYPEAVEVLAESLENDTNDLVRRACAWSLGNLGKIAVPAIPRLIAQVGGKQEYVGYMCARALGDITKAVLGQAVTFNFDPTMRRRERSKIQKQWEAWWKKNQEKLLPN